MENLLLIIVGIAIVLAVSYAVFNFFCVKKLSEGTEKMGDIAGNPYRRERFHQIRV